MGQAGMFKGVSFVAEVATRPDVGRTFGGEDRQTTGVVAVPVRQDDRLDRQVRDFSHLGQYALGGLGIHAGVDNYEAVHADDH